MIVLLTNDRSPYARRCDIVWREAGLEGQVRRRVFDPHGDPAELIAANPLGRVPAMLLDGDAYFGSLTICAILASRASTPLFPIDTPEAAHRRALRVTLADAATDLAVERVMERRKPADEKSPTLDARRKTQLLRGLDALEVRADAFDGPLALDQICLGCALGYLDFRFADDDWRSGRPQLAAWFERFGRRPSMRATEPPAD